MGRQWTKEENEILFKYCDLISAKELHNKYLSNRSIDCIKVRKSQYKKDKLKLNPTKFWSLEEDTIIKDKYGKIDTKYLTIQFLPNRTLNAVHLRAKYLNIKILQTPIINHNFFDEPNLENCYIAGWLASDGYIQGTRVSLGLNEYDKNILEKLKIMLNSNHILAYYKANNKQTNHITYNWRWTFRSKQIVKNLNEHWNIINKKSLTLQRPKDYISGDLALSYLKGYFEGDGCWQPKPQSLQFVGTCDMMNWIREICHKYVDKTLGYKDSGIYKYSNIFRYRLYSDKANKLHNSLNNILPQYNLKRKYNLEEYLKYKNYRDNRVLECIE
jgi:hypothetical protein